MVPLSTGDAREEQLREMVAAPPDAENPFRTRKSRRRRAAKILAQREQDLREQAGRPFDWRTYKSRTQHDMPEQVG